MGLDIGAVMVKGVIVDIYDNIISSSCLYNEGNPVKTVKMVIREMQKDIDLEKYAVLGIGVTGSARKLIGKMLDAVVIKNEVLAQARGTAIIYPGVRTILEIGGEDSKIILIRDGKVIDYAINTLCGAGVGAFINDMAKLFGVRVDDISKLALNSKKRIDVSSKCAIFAKSELLHKVQEGYKKEDIMAGISLMVAKNYVNNVAMGKKIQTPIVFNGGVSKNEAVVKNLSELLGEEIIVGKNSHLMGAIGVAILARESKIERVFDFDIENYNIETKLTNCLECANNCEIVMVYKNDKLVDKWGNKCVNESKDIV